MNLRVLSAILGAILLVSGLGIAVNAESLMSMCRTGCWFNGLLYAFVGEHYGRFVLAAIWYTAGIWLLYRGVVGWRSDRNVQ